MPKRRPGAPADLEELRPGYFVVHNSAVGPGLRGEGERDGDRFRLTSWRREGLIARLRAKEFVVLTLSDQIAALPALPTIASPGPMITHTLARQERISGFGVDPHGVPGWQPLAETAPGQVCLALGWSIRRRKGRSPGSYAHVSPAGLQPLADEEAAIRLGYAVLSHTNQRPPLATTGDEQSRWLPVFALPQAHRTLLGRIAERGAAGWRFAVTDQPLVAALLARLGLALGSLP
ncbi:MAG: hypothetical protein AB4911_00845 [Oscillochloridaceae bacterium umkhey_bin13]